MKRFFLNLFDWIKKNGELHHFLLVLGFIFLLGEQVQLTILSFLGAIYDLLLQMRREAKQQKRKTKKIK